MKKLNLISFILFIVLHNSTLSAQINFEHAAWSEILAKAKAEHKPIFMDAYTSWCGPCKEMAKNVFTNDSVTKYYNIAFVNAKIDMEAGEGKDLARVYNVNAYPSLLFIDENGELLHRAVGTRTSAEFIQLGKDAQLPEKQLMSLEKKYKSGVRNTQFMTLYLRALEGVSPKDTKEPLNAYFDTQKEQDWTSPANWKIINSHLSDYQSKVFNYLVKHNDVFAAKYTADSVNKKIFDIYVNACQSLIYSREADSVKFFQLTEEIKKSGFARSEELVLREYMMYYQKKKDYINYAKAAVPYIDKYKRNDAADLGYAANYFYKNLTDSAFLAKAEQWAEKCFLLDPNPQVRMDSFAFSLSQMGRMKEAVKFQRKAIEFIKADPQKQYESWIPDMEKKIAEWSK